MDGLSSIFLAWEAMEHLLLVVQSERDQHECPSTPPRAKKARTHDTRATFPDNSRRVLGLQLDDASANIVGVIKANAHRRLQHH